jgi:hypothetical protein
VRRLVIEATFPLRPVAAGAAVRGSWHTCPDLAAPGCHALQTRRRNTHIRRFGHISAVDPGFVVDPVHPRPPDQPQDPDQPQ